MKKLCSKAKKFICVLLCASMVLPLVACGDSDDRNYSVKDYEYTSNYALTEATEAEAKACFKYLWELAQTDESTGAYGLVRDAYPHNNNVASTAVTGYALAAIPYAIEKGWITEEEGKERAEKTMDTILSLDNHSGFLYHFINMQNGRRSGTSEVSVIDTGILLCGMIVAGEYFGGTVKEKAMQYYDSIDWNFYLDENRQMFYMGYTPEKGFEGHWDYYGEQLMLYVLSAGSYTYPLDKTPYYTFKREEGSYRGYTFVNSWHGSIFTYQFSHAFVDFRGLVDEQGMDWYQNSVDATLAAREYCIFNKDKYATYGENSWGLTASLTKDGYDGKLGVAPSGAGNTGHKAEGTIAIAGALGSFPFAPEYCISALENYASIDRLMGDYGLYDAYNLEQNWYAKAYIGIDKGISLLMIANYESDIIWDLFMQNENVQKGMDVLGFTEKTE